MTGPPLLALTIGDWAIAEDVSEWIEAVAIAVIAVAVVVAFVQGTRTMFRSGATAAVEVVKQHIGRALLLGLDLLIAADVIRTVTLEPTLENVSALGVLVLVRTFLAWSLVVELEGRWPWQSKARPATEPGKVS
ncbi:putative membrane protein [Ilumatobacter fluminis]|uniref:Putative membrane protein n=1 Tax=Ilumatobacter fluminis TaxID=467091 RepID=A0A4R7HZC7_9ACTN|nr:DUF1622 domain-containing protein [Ilumatobacter fluminis]TDT15899.1 putative membrane protein [Ilumatobacter fluminis]